MLDPLPPAEAGGNSIAGFLYFELECGFSPFKPEDFCVMGLKPNCIRWIPYSCRDVIPIRLFRFDTSSHRDVISVEKMLCNDLFDPI